MQSPVNVDVKVFAECCQGGRKYMEDCHCIAFQEKARSVEDDTSDDSGSLSYVFFGVFDGHGGKEAAIYTKENLLRNIVSNRNFWSRDDKEILDAIKNGFVSTHYAMLNEVGKWPKTTTGLPSTSGTTASVCFLMNQKYYIGHVGDSRILIARRSENSQLWKAVPLTSDHKPDSPEERERIINAGGKIMNKSGIERVVWNRPKCGHKGPVRRSTHFDEIPFLAVARSLGDLWSYNSAKDVFVVSPEPDVSVIPVNPEKDICIVLASDGLWNMIGEDECVEMLQEFEERNSDGFIAFNPILTSQTYNNTINPAQALVQFALQRWFSNCLRADNTSVVVAFLDHKKQKDDINNVNNVNKSSKDPFELSDEDFSALNNPTVVSSDCGEYFIDSRKNTQAIVEKPELENSFKFSPDLTNIKTPFDFTHLKNNVRSSLPEAFYIPFNENAQKPLQTINGNGLICKAVQENCINQVKICGSESVNETVLNEDKDSISFKTLKSSCESVGRLTKDNEENKRLHTCVNKRCDLRRKMRTSFVIRHKFERGRVTKKKWEALSSNSPPSKRLRSSNWSRAKISLPYTSSVLSRTIAANLLTRSRLRAIKYIKDPK